MDNVVKQTELLEKTGVYDEDLKRRFALTLKYNGMKGKKVLVIGMNPVRSTIFFPRVIRKEAKCPNLYGWK